MIDLQQKSGVIENFCTLRELETWKTKFQIFSPSGPDFFQCWGINWQNSLAELWFQKTIFDRLKPHCDKNMKSIFAMYSNSTKPWHLHDDLYHMEHEWIKGKPYITWLIPFQVDEDPNKTPMAATVVFNEKNFNGPKNQLQKDRLTHCNSNELETVTVHHMYQWQVGNLIWWDMTLIHASASFDGFSSKQMLVGHTYLET